MDNDREDGSMTDTKAILARDLEAFETMASELHTHPDNARRGDITAIAESLQRFGQLRPIVALKNGTIVAGNHTYRAAVEELGWDTVAAIRVDLSDEEATAYLLADNRTSELGTMDPEALAALVERAMMAPGGLAGTGYTEADVDDLAAELAGLDLEEFEYEEPTNVHDERHTATEATPEKLAASRPMEQFILLYHEEDAELLRESIKTLSARWGMSGGRTVVLEALKRQAASDE